MEQPPVMRTFVEVNFQLNTNKSAMKRSSIEDYIKDLISFQSSLSTIDYVE